MCNLCIRSVTTLSKLTQHKSITSSIYKRCYHTSLTTFGAHKVPVLPEQLREPDNIYRRPNVLPYNAPLEPMTMLTWHDAQAPEPVLDSFPNAPPPNVALRHLLQAFALLGVLFGINALYRYKPYQPTIDAVYPYDNFRLEFGGLNGAKKSDGQREDFFTPLPVDKRKNKSDDDDDDSGDQ